MKHTLLVLLVLLMSPAISVAETVSDEVNTPLLPREIRAVWLCTLGGIDWPQQAATTSAGWATQRKDLVRQLNALQKAGVNVVLFQARTRASVAYPSEIDPWDYVYTGKAGGAPDYDPLGFVVAECHKRNMECHAYVVTFPAGKYDVAKRFGSQAINLRYPDLVRRSKEQWMLDPGMPGTATYLASVCEEIVRKYDVDGIHLDYARYPEKGFEIDDSQTYKKYGNGQNKADWRRANVTRCVKAIHDAVKAVRPWVKVSCSPIGKYADLRRQSSGGWNARNAVYQEAQEWLRDGLMDWLFPMQYFDGKNFYPFCFDWQENSYGHPIVAGLGTWFLADRNWSLETIRRQMEFTRQIGYGGYSHFRTKYFLANHKGIYDFQCEFNKQPAMTPAMTWQDSIAPAAPKVTLNREGYSMRITWNVVADDTPVHYNIYRVPRDGESAVELLLTVRPDSATVTSAYTYVYSPALPALLHDLFVVTAIDAYGNESAVRYYSL